MEKYTTVVGFYEDISIQGKIIRAKIDTGASTSSISAVLANSLETGPVVKRTTVVNSYGSAVRPVIKLDVEIAGKKITASFNIAIRQHLRYPILIGKNILRKGFIVDPKKRLKKSKENTIRNTEELNNSI